MTFPRELLILIPQPFPDGATNANLGNLGLVIGDAILALQLVAPSSVLNHRVRCQDRAS